MTEQLNAIINARLPRKDGLYKLTIAGGRFTNILPMPGPAAAGDNELDAAGIAWSTATCPPATSTISSSSSPSSSAASSSPSSPSIAASLPCCSSPS